MSAGYDLNPDGTVTFELDDGVERILKRPSLATYRAVIERLTALRDTATRAVEDGRELSPAEQTELLIGWNDYVFGKLSTTGDSLPKRQAWFNADGEEVSAGAEGAVEKTVLDEEKIPAWLLSATVITDLITHWQSVPSRHGGQ